MKASSQELKLIIFWKKKVKKKFKMIKQKMRKNGSYIN